MEDVLILLALAVWSGLWLLRELDRGGVSRRHASGSLRRARPRPVGPPDDGRDDGSLLDPVGRST
ncbi:hypothetical protein [Nocardioides okcheonensis]|uniref:hypothetical protein n=1 Tax=Nocardioides okcheonensis TaxID=2894081 RepID=UPI001E425B34|nr:hypothetical protein [Nocardioides okcheonensis]UFN44684.1 hypothetical protein LN652_00200 [Nocardioides okcheonensis]